MRRARRSIPCGECRPNSARFSRGGGHEPFLVGGATEAVAVAMDGFFVGLPNSLVDDLAGDLVDEVSDYLRDRDVPDVRLETGDTDEKYRHAGEEDGI